MASGAQISRSSCWTEKPVRVASNVSTLNHRVPTNWIAALHHAPSRPKRAPRRSVAWRSSSAAASVKKIDPRKKRTASGPEPMSWTTPGNGPMRKQTEPIPNPAAIGRSHPASAPGPDLRSSA